MVLLMALLSFLRILNSSSCGHYSQSCSQLSCPWPVLPYFKVLDPADNFPLLAPWSDVRTFLRMHSRNLLEFLCKSYVISSYQGGSSALCRPRPVNVWCFQVVWRRLHLTLLARRSIANTTTTASMLGLSTCKTLDWVWTYPMAELQAFQLISHRTPFLTFLPFPS